MAQFGYRVPDFPTNGDDAQTFLSHVRSNMDIVAAGGFDSAWVADHFVPWAAWQEVDTPTVECLTTISHLSAIYRDLTWGPIVLCQSYHNPAILAKRVASICSFIPGKFVFGIGAGWKDDEYRAYNIPFPSARVRIEQMAEAIQIAKLLWTTPAATYEGQYYAIHGATVNPRPDPLPPVMVGGGGEKRTLRVVAEHADWWNLGGGTVENYQRKLDILRGHCDAVGRDFESIVRTWSCSCIAVAETQAEAETKARQSPFYDEAGAVVGTPDQVRSQLQRWMDIGVAHFQLRFADFPRTDGLEMFIRDVLPALR